MSNNHKNHGKPPPSPPANVDALSAQGKQPDAVPKQDSAHDSSIKTTTRHGIITLLGLGIVAAFFILAEHVIGASIVDKFKEMPEILIPPLKAEIDKITQNATEDTRLAFAAATAKASTQLKEDAGELTSSLREQFHTSLKGELDSFTAETSTATEQAAKSAEAITATFKNQIHTALDSELTHMTSSIGEEARRATESLKGVSALVREKLRGSAQQRTRSPKVLVVFPNTEVSRPIVDGIKIHEPIKLPYRGELTFEWIQEDDDPEKTQRSVRARLEDKDAGIVLVIGHENSTQAQYVVQHLYEDSNYIAVNEPVPLILVAITNPALTQFQSNEMSHILRLPATDDEQVKAILGSVDRSGYSKLTLELPDAAHRPAVTLLCDTSNPVYSSYLARQLVATAREIRVINSFGLGLSGNGYDFEKYLSCGEIADVPALVFLGMEEQASILLNGLQPNLFTLGPPKDSRPIRVVFSDGALGTSFIALCQRVLRTSNRRMIIEILAPFAPGVSRGSPLAEYPNYSQYASAARAIAERLVRDAWQHVPAGADSESEHAGISRHDVLEQMHVLQSPGHSQPFATIDCSFDKNGDNTLAKFHVFRVTNDSLLHSESCPCQ